MKLVWLFLIVFSGVLFGEEMEVRSYQVGETLFFQVHYQNTASGDSFGDDPFASDEVREDYRGKVLKEAPFKSRFFKGAGELKDCSKGMGELLNEKEWKGMAVLNLKEGTLVVKAGARDHRAIAEIFEGMLGGQIEIEVAIYRVKGVRPGTGARDFDKVRQEGELLAGLGFLQLSSVPAEARAGGLGMKTEAILDRDFELVESRVELCSTFPGVEFELKTGITTMRGEPVVLELGSLDGKRVLVAVLNFDWVLWSGVKLDEWILKEKGGAFLRKERLVSVEKVAVIEGEGMRRFSVPPTLLTFLTTGGESGGDDDPFGDFDEDPVEVGAKNAQALYQGDHPELAKVPRHKLFDVTTLLKQNGVAFREEDFAVFSEPSSTLIVKATPTNLELVDGIVIHGWDPPRFVRMDFTRVVSSKEIDQESLEKGGLRIREKIGLEAVPGQVGTVKLGKKLVLHAEAQVDGYDELIEMRATLSERGDLEKASFKTGLTLRAGKPVVVQQSRRGEKWVAWVATATVITVGEESE